MDNEILKGIGKKTRNLFLKGQISEEKIMTMYNRNKREAEAFSSYGMTAKELTYMLRECHNPILRDKIEECIKLRNEASRKSSEQNVISLEKLEQFDNDALGVGLRKVISTMKKQTRRSKDKTLKLLTLLLETEFANLSAKSHGKSLKRVIYERKSLLLSELSELLNNTDWKYGYNDNSGKNANYIIYIYLPNGVQLSWHCNDYTTAITFPYIESEWDGKVCATMEKIIDYIGNNYSNLFQQAA